MATVTLGTNSTAGELSATSSQDQCVIAGSLGATICIKNLSTSAANAKINLETVHGTSDFATLEAGDTRYYRPSKASPTLKFKTSSSTATLAVDIVLLGNPGEQR